MQVLVMKKKVEQQLEELTPQERKIIFRAGMIHEYMGYVLIVVTVVVLVLSFWNRQQAENEYNDIWNAYRAERENKGYFLSELTDYDITMDDTSAAGTRMLDAQNGYILHLIITCVAMLFYLISANIYLRKKIPYYTMRRFSYLFWSKKRRKKLFEE